MMIRTGLLSLAMVCTFCAFAGCAPERDEVASLLEELRVPNTEGLNGIRLNGIRLNGIRLNGIRLNNASLGGVALSGMRLTGVDGSGAGSVLTGEDDKGKLITAGGAVGATLQGDLSDGTTLTLRIDSFKGAKVADVYAYTASYFADGAWQPLCGVDGGGKPIEVIALGGAWNEAQGVPGGGSHTADATRFTFACRNAALGKCTDWGYRPWASSTLAERHQACTRMVRADYCGDGTPWTVEGVTIDAYDAVGVMSPEQPDWPVEAEWDAAGALCVASRRSPQVSWSTGGDPSTCWQWRRLEGSCGSAQHFGQGVLLMNRHMP